MESTADEILTGGEDRTERTMAETQSTRTTVCVDCGASILHRGVAAKRCEDCFESRKRDYKRDYLRKKQKEAEKNLPQDNWRLRQSRGWQRSDKIRPHCWVIRSVSPLRDVACVSRDGDLWRWEVDNDTDCCATFTEAMDKAEEALRSGS